MKRSDVAPGDQWMFPELFPELFVKVKCEHCTECSRFKFYGRCIYGIRTEVVGQDPKVHITV